MTKMLKNLFSIICGKIKKYKNIKNLSKMCGARRPKKSLTI
jgi:hypothetical protein